ncbi:MAG: YHS domain-containing protein [Planctomycetes bacterium]|nr:YHS domain-containing protein [Planctomycetota bacterium]
MNRYAIWTGLLLFACATMAGCDKPPATSPAHSTSAGAGGGQTQTASDEKKPVAADDSSAKPKRTIKPIEIGATSSTSTASPADSSERVESARAALKPLQILIGNWNGTSRKAAIDQPNWAWDLKTDPKQPALRIKSDKGQFIRDGRLTFYPATQQFELTATDGEGKKRIFQGGFSQEVQDVPGDDNKLQRTYKLELTEPQPDSDGEQWRVVINQQENNRYIMELDRKRGSSPYLRIDTINTQREGTSFALSDTDYGDKTCVVSQGLGTTSVSYKGKTYWVCCSGCKAAFEDEPEKWIARFEAMSKDKMPKP